MIRITKQNLINPTDNEVKFFKSFRTLKDTKKFMLQLLEDNERHYSLDYQELKTLKLNNINQYYIYSVSTKANKHNFYISTLEWEYTFTYRVKPTVKRVQKLIASVGLQDLHTYGCSIDTFNTNIGLGGEILVNIFIDNLQYERFSTCIELMLKAIQKVFKIEKIKNKNYITYSIGSM